MENHGYKTVDAEAYERFPGDKSKETVNGMTTYAIAADQTRPMSARARRLADRILDILMEEGMLREMAVGGLPLAEATRDIASAMVAVQDECSPQYARGSVVSLANLTSSYAKEAADWAAGAGRRSTTLVSVSVREQDLEPSPRL